MERSGGYKQKSLETRPQKTEIHFQTDITQDAINRHEVENWKKMLEESVGVHLTPRFNKDGSMTFIQRI